MTSLFNEYNYNISLNSFDKSHNSIMKAFTKNIQVITMIPTILIIVLTNFLSFCLFFSKIKRTISIHYICGATDIKLFIHLFKEIFTSIIFATIVGILIGSIVLYFSYTDLFYKYIFIAAFINIALLSIIVLLSFLCNKKRIYY